MPLYHITLTCENQRSTIVVDHVLEEYGISEQEFVSTWFLDRPEIQGDGDTVEQAIESLFKDLEKFKSKEWSPTDELRHQFYKSIKRSERKWNVPVIGNGCEVADVAPIGDVVQFPAMHWTADAEL